MMRRTNNKPKKMMLKKKPCKFCLDNSLQLDYKESTILRNFMTDRGKIMPSRISGNCARHQRALKIAIKRSRNLSLLPYTTIIES